MTLQKSNNALETEQLTQRPEGIVRAAALLVRGALVSFPTETVYGLGADATNGTAVARIFEAKGRPQFNPLIVHVASVAQARALVALPAALDPLIAAHWPGPLTIVAPLLPGTNISPLVSAGLETLAIRIPAHPVALDLLRAVGTPIAAPSANPSGAISPTSAAHVQAGLGGLIEAILDGGPCDVGLESTIISAEARPRLLRHGGLSVEAIEAVLRQPLLPAQSGEITSKDITAPGQLLKHYATKTPLVLNQPEPLAVHIGFGTGSAALNLSLTSDLREAAANLFAHLHKADALAQDIGAEAISVAPIPNEGLGRAINDRLTRAAA